jgi:hypothetical protein
MRKAAVFLPVAFILMLSACGAAAATSPAREMFSVQGSAKDSTFNSVADAAGAAPAAPAVAESQGSGAPGLVPVVNPTDRIVLMDAAVTLVVNDPADAAAKITDMAFAKGGWVVNSNITQSVYGVNGEKYYAGQISIRVPAKTSDDLKATLAEIEALAVEVKSRSLNGVDVTAEYTDAQSRLRNLQASRDRLLAIMETAVDTEAILKVEEQLRQVTGEIEVLEGQINYYDTAAKYSLITISLEPYVPSQPIDIAGWHPEGVAKQALEDLVHGLQDLVDFLIRLGICGLPALVVIAIFAAPFFLIGRALVRRYNRTHPVK